MSELVQFEKKKNYAKLVLNSSKSKNTLNLELLEAIQSCLQKVTSDKSIRLIILTGEGDKFFSDGSDIGKISTFTAKEAEEYIRLGQSVLNTIYRADIISIAALNGDALGTGLELALSCDMRFAASHAKLGFPEVKMGLIPFFGGTQRLPRMIGLGQTFEMILSARLFEAEESRAIGLINHVYSSGELLAKTEEMAQKMLDHNGPTAQKMARWLIHSSLDLPMSAGLEREIISFSEIFSGKEAKEGMKAYAENRLPNF